MLFVQKLLESDAEECQKQKVGVSQIYAENVPLFDLSK